MTVINTFLPVFLSLFLPLFNYNSLFLHNISFFLFSTCLFLLLKQSFPPFPPSWSSFTLIFFSPSCLPFLFIYFILYSCLPFTHFAPVWSSCRRFRSPFWNSSYLFVFIQTILITLFSILCTDVLSSSFLLPNLYAFLSVLLPPFCSPAIFPLSPCRY